MAHRVVERLGGLAGQRAPGRVGDGAGNDQRQPRAARGEGLLDREQRRLGVQRVEHRLDQQQIDAAFQQAARPPRRRPRTSSSKLIARKPGSLTSGEMDAVLLVGPSTPATKRGCPACAPATRAPRRVARRGRGAVQLARQRLHAVVGQRDRGRVEGVGLDDVGAGREVLRVDVADQPRLREREQVVVAAQLARPVAEARAAVVLLGKPRALDHGAHGAVQQQDALAQQLLCECRRVRKRKSPLSLRRNGLRRASL